MSRPNIFVDFEKNTPSASPYVIRPNADEEPNDEETKQATKDLLSQIFRVDTVSSKMIRMTKCIFLLRPLEYIPEVNGKQDVFGYDWFVGHYDWAGLLSRLVEVQTAHQKIKYSIYLVPTLGQSLQGSKRHDLTYNAFICPSKKPPFTHLIQRLPTPEQPEDVDLDLDQKADPIVFRTLESLGLEWKHTMNFDKSNCADLGDNSFDVLMLTTSASFNTGLSRMPQEEFEKWYDVVMGNFLPFIPAPTTDGQHSFLPLVIVDPVECTPPCYKELVATVQAVNAALGEGSDVRIENIIKYWQYSPVQVAKALTIFVNNGNAIPEKNPEFNELFVEQFNVAREFIVDEVFEKLLKIKRTEDDEEPSLWKGTQAEIDWELDYFDLKARKLYGQRPEVIEALKPLKALIPFWFDRDTLPTIYGQFKATISAAMRQMIGSEQFQSYLRLSAEYAADAERAEWLHGYYRGELECCLWPTIYTLTGPVFPKRGTNPLLEQVEAEHLSTIHVSIPGIKGVVLPPKPNALKV